MAWKASTTVIPGANDQTSLRHICELYGVCVTMPPTEPSSLDSAAVRGRVGAGTVGLPGLHMVMELLDCEGDVHDVIHDDTWWVKVRDRGMDTGAKIKKGLLMHDGHDVWMCVQCAPPLAILTMLLLQSPCLRKLLVVV